MDTKEFVIDEETMEQLKEVSVRKRLSLEESIKKYIYFLTEGHKKIDQLKMSPSLAGFAGIMGKVSDDYDWRETAETERDKIQKEESEKRTFH